MRQGTALAASTGMFSHAFPVMHPLGVPAREAQVSGRTIVTAIREGLCGLSGHEFLLHTEPSRLFLRCMECGHETPGWNVAAQPRRR